MLGAGGGNWARACCTAVPPYPSSRPRRGRLPASSRLPAASFLLSSAGRPHVAAEPPAVRLRSTTQSGSGAITLIRPRAERQACPRNAGRGDRARGTAVGGSRCRGEHPVLAPGGDGDVAPSRREPFGAAW